MPVPIHVQKNIVNHYLEGKLSVSQIADKLKMPNTTVNYYLLKQGVKKRSVSESIYEVYATRFGKKSFKLKQNLSATDEKLKVAGAMLYWGEGTKKGNGVYFSNSDPEMIKVFLRFLRKICGVREERLKILLYAYPDQNKNKLEKFWSSVTNIPLKQFQKTYIQKGKKGTYTKKSEYGTICLRYSDKRLLGIIKGWIEDCNRSL